MASAPEQRYSSIDQMADELDRGGVVVEQRSRDLGPAFEIVTPESIVTEQLEALSRTFADRNLVFEGITFAHLD